MDPDDHLDLAEVSESAWSHNAVGAVGPALSVVLPVLALVKLVRKLLRRR